MRADFYYRLNVVRLRVPPLRERRDDIPLLIARFLATDPLARRLGVTEVCDDVQDDLCSRDWPGNVRELLNALRRGLVHGSRGGCIWSVDEAPVTPVPPAAPARVVGRQAMESFRAWMRQRECEYMLDLVQRHRSAAERAHVSGLPPRTLSRKLRALGSPGSAFR